MNEIIPFNFEGNQVRTIQYNSLTWFAAADVAKGLGLTNTTVAISSLDSDERSKFNLGRQGETNFINEPGLYKMIGASHKPAAKRFNRWVTHEVLPSIRKEGAYVTPKTAYDWMANPDNMIQFLEKYKQSQDEVQRLHDEKKIMEPKARFADAVGGSNDTILVRELAKLLKQNGVVIGQNRLFIWLREHGYLIRSGRDRNRPTQRAMDLGLFRVRELVIEHSDGHTTIKGTTLVTGKGQRYFIDKFLRIKQEA